MSYRIAAPDEYLAITGMGIKNVKIAKASWVMPFQRCARFSVQPHDYAMNLQAMTKEKLQFLLPVVFTVGPDVNARGANSKYLDAAGAVVDSVAAASGADGSDAGDHSHGNDHVHDGHAREDRGDALMKYAILLAKAKGESPSSGGTQYLEGIVKGIIEGEVRVLVSSLTMEEIFTEREVFKRRIFRNIQSELDQFGLKIYNANVKELKDAPGSVYFESLSRKAHEGATNQARIDVAEAQLRGNVGEAKRHGEQEREIAKIHAETAVQKTERDVERAQAESTLATKKAGLDRDVEVARIEAKRATQQRDEELKREVETKKAAAELERLRAVDVVKATIAREAKQQAADASAYEVTAQAKAAYEKSTRAADANAYTAKRNAEVEAETNYLKTLKATEAAAFKTETDAKAWSAAAIVNAEANKQKKVKEAEGVEAMAAAYAKMADAFGGPAGLLSYLMIEKGTYVELAKANAAAVQGLQPKISVWNTGAQGQIDNGSVAAAGGMANTTTDTLRNVYQMLPPLMTTINEQTGITLPEWQFGRLAGDMSRAEREKGGSAGKKALQNGSD